MRPSVSVFDSVADIYVEKYFDVSQYNASLDHIISNLNSGDRLCDLACGPGNLSFYLSKRIKNLVITGVDLSENMLKIAKQKIPTGNFILNDITSFKHLLRQKQHLILCGFGIPYLSKPELTNMISDISNSLVKGGVFYLSFMSGDDQIEKVYSSQNPDQFIYTNFHNPDTVSVLSKEKGFELIHTNQHEAPSKDVEMIFRLSH